MGAGCGRLSHLASCSRRAAAFRWLEGGRSLRKLANGNTAFSLVSYSCQPARTAGATLGRLRTDGHDLADSLNSLSKACGGLPLTASARNPERAVSRSSSR